MKANNNHNNPFQKQKPIEGIKKVLLVSSGKGGVGKSTVAAHLALALQKRGKATGLLDADFYGPSIPRMLGCLEQRPEVNAEHRIQPLERYNLKLMSIGFLVSEADALVWRGPMLFKAIHQFLHEVEWGELDYLVVDMPPGTGDVPLSIAQKVKVSGALIVSTPQNLAFADVKKAINMFFQVQIPILGLVENMSYLMYSHNNNPSDNSRNNSRNNNNSSSNNNGSSHSNNSTQGEKIQLFPKGELDAYLKSKNLEKMAEIPFYPQLALACETGMPLLVSQPENEASKCFLSLAQRIEECLE